LDLIIDKGQTAANVYLPQEAFLIHTQSFSYLKCLLIKKTAEWNNAKITA